MDLMPAVVPTLFSSSSTPSLWVLLPTVKYVQLVAMCSGSVCLATQLPFSLLGKTSCVWSFWAVGAPREIHLARYSSHLPRTESSWL